MKVALALVLCAACSSPSPPAVTVSPAPPIGLSADVSLADWGVASVADVALVRVTVADVEKPALRVAELVDRIRETATVPERAGAPLRFIDDVAMMATLANGHFNRFGGSFARFEKAPSRASVDIHDRSARFSYDRRGGGFAGFWVHLFNGRAPRRDRQYVDASAARFLLFEIRGEAGGEEVALQVADGRWQGKGDSLRIGPVGELVDGGAITTTWKRVVVPIERLARLDATRLASFVIVADGGAGTVFVRNIAFATRADADLATEKVAPAPARPMRVAMWVWKAGEVARSRSEIAALVAHCRARAVTDLFLQVPAPATRGAPRTAADLAGLEPLVVALNAAGVRVEALDGAPSLALAKNHHINQATVQAVIDYNRARPAGARFAGIRLDNEPYLLPGFRGPRKAAISRQYLDALEKATTLARSGGLTMGADIPFWFDTYNARDELGAGLDGRPLSELVLERVDNISIMDYRTEAHGADGVIAHAWDEIAFATRAGKQVYVALETEDLPDERHEDFSGPARDGEPVLVLLPTAGGAVRLIRLDATDRARAEKLVAGTDGARVLGRTAVSRLDAGKLSFARQELEDLDRVIRQSWSDLSTAPSLIGIAIHSYESYRRWRKAAESAHP